MPRRWRIALSLVWGLTLASLAALGAAIALFSFGWLFLYGDDPWPAGFTGAAVPLVAAFAGIGVFGAVLALAAYLGRTYPNLERRLHASRAMRWGALAAPPLLVIGLLLIAISQERAMERARAEWERAELRYARAHRLDSAMWRLDPAAGQLWIEVTTTDAASGSYVLSWEARAAGAAQPLDAGAAVHELPSGPARLILGLDATGLARRYAEEVLSRPEPVEIEVTLAVTLSLAPEDLQPRHQGLRLTVPLAFAYQPNGPVGFIPRLR